MQKSLPVDKREWTTELRKGRVSYHKDRWKRRSSGRMKGERCNNRDDKKCLVALNVDWTTQIGKEFDIR